MTSVAAWATLVCCEVRTDTPPRMPSVRTNMTVSVQPGTIFQLPTDSIVKGQTVPEEPVPYITGPASRPQASIATSNPPTGTGRSSYLYYLVVQASHLSLNFLPR